MNVVNISTYNISQYGKSTSVSVGFLTGTTLTFPPGLLGDTMLIKMNIHGKEKFIIEIFHFTLMAKPAIECKSINL